MLILQHIGKVYCSLASLFIVSSRLGHSSEKDDVFDQTSVEVGILYLNSRLTICSLK